MYASHEFGKQGEDYACQYLETKGYQIIQRNFSCKQGEIDIIAKDKEEYVKAKAFMACYQILFIFT